MRQLVAAFVDHLVVADHEAVLYRVIVKLGAGIGVGDGDLNGFDVQFFGEGDRVVDGLVESRRAGPG